MHANILCLLTNYREKKQKINCFSFVTLGWGSFWFFETCKTIFWFEKWPKKDILGFLCNAIIRKPKFNFEIWHVAFPKKSTNEIKLNSIKVTWLFQKISLNLIKLASRQFHQNTESKSTKQFAELKATNEMSLKISGISKKSVVYNNF